MEDEPAALPSRLEPEVHQLGLEEEYELSEDPEGLPGQPARR